MAERSIWLSGKEASEVLRVDEQTLEILRVGGYLRPGSHWRRRREGKREEKRI